MGTARPRGRETVARDGEHERNQRQEHREESRWVHEAVDAAMEARFRQGDRTLRRSRASVSWIEQFCHGGGRRGAKRGGAHAIRRLLARGQSAGSRAGGRGGAGKSGERDRDERSKDSGGATETVG